jgi:riboflavin kinase/FMN adenylyltransferase
MSDDLTVATVAKIITDPMKVIRHLDAMPDALRGGALTIGNFDGVHRGHARLIERLIEHARRVQGPAVVFTFDPHPVRLLRPAAAPPPLTWTERKAELLDELGVDCMIAYPTDEALLALGPREFFEHIVRDALHAQAMVEGPNFYFGHDRRGDVLRELTHEAGIMLEVVEPITIDGELVSSSRVRALIASGDVEHARRLLTHPYRIRGMVTHGAGRGARLGFPTANVDAIDTLLPAIGVYAGVAHTSAGSWAAAINIGPNPTFGEHATKVEAHLIGVDLALYAQPLELDFLARLRDVHAFTGVDALKAQLNRDVADVRKIFSEFRE